MFFSIPSKSENSIVIAVNSDNKINTSVRPRFILHLRFDELFLEDECSVTSKKQTIRPVQIIMS